MALKAIIFDMDGTLIDTVDLHAESWRQALAKFGKDVTFEAVREQIGKGGDQLMPVFLSKEEIERVGEDLESYRKDLFFREFFPKAKAFPCCRELVERIRDDGKQVALATSAAGDELAKYKKLAGIDDLLDEEATSDDSEKSKPHPDIFQAVLGKLKLTASECLVIGDTPYDSEAAMKAGIATVGVLSGGFPISSLKSAGCVRIYGDIQEIFENYEDSPLNA